MTITFTPEEREDLVKALLAAVDDARFVLAEDFVSLDEDPGYVARVEARIKRWNALLRRFE